MPYRPGAGRLDQVRAGQHAQQPAGLRHGGAGERRGGVRVEVGAGVQAEQPERPGGVGVQVPVGPGEHGPHRGARVPAGVQQVQPAAAGRPARRPARPAGRPGGRRRARRPPAAPAAAAQHCSASSAAAPGSASARGADQRPQQRDRLLQRQQVQVQARGAVPGDQPGQRVPAGHHHHAGRGAGQQRPDLLGRSGVVQHDQHPPAGQQAAVPGGPLVRLRRDVLAGHAQRAQEPGQRVAAGIGWPGS